VLTTKERKKKKKPILQHNKKNKEKIKIIIRKKTTTRPDNNKQLNQPNKSHKEAYLCQPCMDKRDQEHALQKIHVVVLQSVQ
jgi:hypothetical protein